jgi:lipoprotein-releasing system permease protein
MSRLPFEAFLALRYLRPRRTFVSVITLISIIGVLLGVAVLIVVISVMSGFDQEWRDRILGFNAHLTVYPAEHDQPFAHYQEVMKIISSNADVVGVSPFIHSQVLVKTEPDTGKPRRSVPWLFGVDAATVGKVNDLPTSIVSGSFDLTEKGLVIGRDYAEFNGLDVGDRLAIYSPDSLEKAEATAGKTNAEAALAEDFIVRGIFDVGFPDYNSSIIVASLEDARDLLAMPDNTVQGLQVRLQDPFQASAVASQLRAVLSTNDYVIQTWQDDPSSVIFNALATEKEMMFYLLFFIMIVAAFGIINCQITFVVQKTREIGILKALGATNRQVLWLFLSQSVIVGVLGVGLGLAVAMLALHYRNEFLEFMRHVTHSDLLPAAIYHVYDLPASTQTPDVLFICGTAFAACVLAGLFPAWKASRLQPVEAMRHE